MDQEPEKEAEIKPPTLPKPVIPPPNLAPPPPPPPSPLDGLPSSAPTPPPLTAPGGPPVKVTIRTGDEEETPAGGLAPFNSRVIAAVIDLVISMGVTLLLVFILPDFASKVAWLTGLAYLVTRDSLPFLGGQSVGKKAMKLQVVTPDGQLLTGNWEKAVIRNAALMVPFFALVEIFVLLTREDKPERGLRLGDEWAKTRVIVEPPKPADDDAV
jgi:uncharacterized RDD family membrane protein YckC